MEPVRIYALTGTPGTGKSTVARRLRGMGPTPVEVVEVSDLRPHVRRRPARLRRQGPVLVDLAKAARMLETRALRATGPLVVVGHLSHLLPIERVVLLRCRPDVLRRRLERRGVRGRALLENVEAEAVDVILQEAVGLGRRIWELDTTHLGPAEVAARVKSIVDGRGKPAFGHVDWLKYALDLPARATGRKRGGRSRG